MVGCVVDGTLAVPLPLRWPMSESPVVREIHSSAGHAWFVSSSSSTNGLCLCRNGISSQISWRINPVCISHLTKVKEQRNDMDELVCARGSRCTGSGDGWPLSSLSMVADYRSICCLLPSTVDTCILPFFKHHLQNHSMSGLLGWD